MSSRTTAAIRQASRKAGISSCFARLHVRNPLFEEVQASFQVRFFPGYDEGFYLQLLNQELIAFLSPWAFDQTSEIDFGGQVYKSALINFVEERPYVDYVLDFQLRLLAQGGPQPDQEVVRTSKQVSILVSAPQHNISAIPQQTAREQQEDYRCEPSKTETRKP